MTTCYDFITIRLKHEDIQARPVAWNKEIVDGFGNGSDGKPVSPTEFHATCPYCGNLIHFTVDDIFKDVNETDNVKCLTCRSGNEAVEEVKKQAAIAPKTSIFIDPIATGLFDLEVDMDLLDSAEAS
jgi:hypothetical protein